MVCVFGKMHFSPLTPPVCMIPPPFGLLSLGNNPCDGISQVYPPHIVSPDTRLRIIGPFFAPMYPPPPILIVANSLVSTLSSSFVKKFFHERSNPLMFALSALCMVAIWSHDKPAEA